MQEEEGRMKEQQEESEATNVMGTATQVLMVALLIIKGSVVVATAR